MDPIQGSSFSKVQTTSLEQFPKLGSSGPTTAEKTAEQAQKIGEAKVNDKNVKVVKAELFDTSKEEVEKNGDKKELNKRIGELKKEKYLANQEKNKAVEEKNNALKELEETKKQLKNQEAAHSEDVTLLKSAKENAIAEKNALAEDLQKTQLQVKNLESLKEGFAEMNKQLEQLKESTRVEEKTTLVGKEIKHAKDQLSLLHSDIAQTISTVTNAILKNEIPENYAKNEQQIYIDATQGHSQKADQYTAIFEQLKKNKEDFLKAMKNSNNLADDSNDSWILSERVEKDLHFLEKSIAFPNNLKILSNKVNVLLSSVNKLIEKGYIETANCKEISQKIEETEADKKSTEADNAKKEKTEKTEQDKPVRIENLHDELVKLKNQNTALRSEIDQFNVMLKDIEEFKKLNFDAPPSQESKQTKISGFFTQINESVQYWEKDFVAQNNLKDYQIYDPEKKEDLISKLKITQEKSKTNYTALRNWCAATWNQALNDLDLGKCKLELLADTVKVFNEMTLTLNELGILKINAQGAVETLEGQQLEKKLNDPLEPKFKEITNQITKHHNQFLELQKKYDEKIAELNKLGKPGSTILDKKLEPQSIHSQLPKDEVMKNIKETQQNIKTLYETQKKTSNSQWDFLFHDRYYYTCADFDKIVDKINSTWYLIRGLKAAVKQIGWISGNFSNEYNKLNSLPSSTQTATTVPTTQVNAT